MFPCLLLHPFTCSTIFPHLFILFLIFCIKLGFNEQLKVSDLRKISHFLSQNQCFEVFPQYVLDTKLCLKLMSQYLFQCFFKLFGMIGLNKQINVPLVNYPKKSSLRPNGHFCLDCGPSSAMLYLRTSSKDFFKLCGVIGDNKSLKTTEAKFLKKILD